MVNDNKHDDNRVPDVLSDYVTEISISTEHGARHYRMKTKDFNSIYSSFRAYYDGWDPVVTKWEDVTDELSDRVPEDVVVP